MGNVRQMDTGWLHAEMKGESDSDVKHLSIANEIPRTKQRPRSLDLEDRDNRLNSLNTCTHSSPRVIFWSKT